MRNAFNESMREVGAPLADFWENDLELGLEDILRRLDTNLVYISVTVSYNSGNAFCLSLNFVPWL